MTHQSSTYPHPTFHFALYARDIASLLKRNGYDTRLFHPVSVVHAVHPCTVLWSVVVAWDPSICIFKYDHAALPVFFPSVIQDWCTLHLPSSLRMYHCLSHDSVTSPAVDVRLRAVLPFASLNHILCFFEFLTPRTTPLHVIVIEEGTSSHFCSHIHHQDTTRSVSLRVSPAYAPPCTT